MRRLFLAIAVACICSATMGGEVTQTYRFSGFNTRDAGEYQLIEFDHCLNTGYAGAPSMPWFAVKLLLPPGEKAVSFSIETKNETSIPGTYRIYPQQPSRPLSHGTEGIFHLDEDIYRSSSVYPENPYGVITTEYLNGHAIAMLNICPLTYIPAEGKLSYFGEISVTIITEKEREAETALNNLSASSRIRSMVADFVQNPAAMDHYPSKDSRSDGYQILIITPAAFEDEFEGLREMYLSRGLKSEVATIEDIGSSMPGQDLPEKVRNYIIQEYQGFSVEHVILGGDVEHVPYRGFYCYVQSGSGYSDDNIPADLYYSGLDGNWNTDGDNLWGEIGEDDLLPDIAVGRMSFSNSNELAAMINKSISYQDTPVLGEMTNPLLAAEFLYSNPETWGSDYLRLLVGYRDDNGYVTIGIPPEQQIDSLYERYQNWGGSDIIAGINEGKSFVHHCGHANSGTVMHLSTSDITNSNFSQVNGTIHNYTFVHSHGCICGAFDDSDCIMERMVAIDNFAAAVIGNSRYGWFNEGQTEGPAAHLHREMVDALYEEEIGRLGAAFVESKIQTAPWVNAPGQWEEGALRWNFYDINILGDPVLQLWTDEPFEVDATFTAPILVGDPSMDVHVTSGGVPVEGLSCSLIKDGILHGTSVTDDNGDATIFFDPLIASTGTATLSISGYNCLTKTYNVVVAPAGGAFLVYQDHVVDDAAGGNGNNLPDFGESILMTINIENAGTADATDVSAILSTDDNYITISDGLGEYGTIPAGSAAGTINDFALDIAGNVPDQHMADLLLDINGDGKGTWTDAFSITINAPVIENGNMTIDDLSGGNGNGFLDPGESATITFGVLNTGHADAPGAMAYLDTESEWITLNTATYELGILEQGVNASASFEVSVDEDTPLGTSVIFGYSVVSGYYSDSSSYGTAVGILVEDWESGGFNAFNWQFAANAPWETCTIEPYEGIYCVRSGDIDDNQQSELYITLEVLAAGDLSFYRKLSSEAEWDFLRFYIDYTMAGEWSGELDWEMVSFPVTQGLHTFRWVYEKDTYLSNGEDCAWVDYIVFPPVDISTGLSQLPDADETGLMLMPNPAHHSLYVDYHLTGKTKVCMALYDMTGRQVKTLVGGTERPAGDHRVMVNVSDLEPGIYLCRLITHTGTLSRKLIVR